MRGGRVHLRLLRGRARRTTPLAALLPILPPGTAVTQTARGYHIEFFTGTEVPVGVLPAYGAEVYGDGQAIHIPPSVHPSGWRYRYVQEPRRDLPTVDLVALGLTPEPKAPRRSSGRHPRRNGSQPAADLGTQARFRDLMARAGITPDRGGDEHLLCPWHADAATRSLHVNWAAVVFFCFGCQTGGGLRDLREHVSPPVCSHGNREPSSHANKRGGGPRSSEVRFPVHPDLAAERDRVVRSGRGVGAGGSDGPARAGGARRSSGGVARGRADVPRGGGVPGVPCGGRVPPGAAVGMPPGGLSGSAPRARSGAMSSRLMRACRPPSRWSGSWRAQLGGGCRISPLHRRLTQRLRAYRERHGLTAGSALRTLHYEDSAGGRFRPIVILAVPPEALGKITSDGAFDVEVLEPACTLARWHALQVAAWRASVVTVTTPEALAGWLRTWRNAQRFRHFGAWYAQPKGTAQEDAPATGEAAQNAPRKRSGAAPAAASRGAARGRCGVPCTMPSCCPRSCSHSKRWTRNRTGRIGAGRPAAGAAEGRQRDGGLAVPAVPEVPRGLSCGGPAAGAAGVALAASRLGLAMWEADPGMFLAAFPAARDLVAGRAGSTSTTDSAPHAE